MGICNLAICVAKVWVRFEWLRMRVLWEDFADTLMKGDCAHKSAVLVYFEADA
jgi:hypothetical protein